jgi:hypothetical protein
LAAKTNVSFVRLPERRRKENDLRMNSTSVSQFVKRCAILAGTSTSIVQFDSNGYLINQVILCFLNCLLTVATVFLNGIAIRTMYKCFRQKGKICYFLIFLQSVTDLMAGALAIPLFTFVQASEIAGTANCVVNFILATVAFIPMGLSLAMLCGLSFERYMGVLHPLVHRNVMTKTVMEVYLGISAVVIVLMMATSLAYPKLYFIFGPVNICISLLLMAFFYTRIFQKARRRSRLQALISGPFLVQHNPCERKKKQQFLKELKIAKSCFLLVVVFVLCVVPVFIVSALSPGVSTKMLPRFRVFQSWAITICLLNHSLNSVVLFWTRPTLRREAKLVMRKICAKEF